MHASALGAPSLVKSARPSFTGPLAHSVCSPHQALSHCSQETHDVPCGRQLRKVNIEGSWEDPRPRGRPGLNPEGVEDPGWDAKPVGGEDPDPIPGNEEGPEPDPNLAGGMDVAPSGDGRTDLSWRL